MNPLNHDVVLSDETAPPIRYIRFAIPKQKAITIIQKTTEITSIQFVTESSLILSGTYNGVNYYQPVEIYTSRTKREDKTMHDFFTQQDGNDHPIEEMVEFAFLGYIHRPDVSVETHRNYVTECDACISQLITLFEEEM